MEAAKDAAAKVADGVKNLQVTDKKQQKKEKKKGGDGDGKSAPKEPPAYLEKRNKVFDAAKARQEEEIKQKQREDITVTLGDGKTIAGKSWETSPADIARGISKSLFERTVIAEVDGELWDLERPLEKSSSLKLLDFEDPKGKQVFWHSSAHILGLASETQYHCQLCNGPPIDDGFYYDMALKPGEAVAEADYKGLENTVKKAISEKQRFERVTLSKEELLEMFSYNPYKQYFINDRVKDGESTTVYRNGPLIDLCRGPHVPHTGRIKAFKVMKNSASYFLGDPSKDSLQRVYGVSFPDKKQLDEHLKLLEQAAQRDHRKLGLAQELFFFHQMSPGSPFLLPHGMVIFNRLQAYLREQYWKRGYQEVMSPSKQLPAQIACCHFYPCHPIYSRKNSMRAMGSSVYRTTLH